MSNPASIQRIVAMLASIVPEQQKRYLRFELLIQICVTCFTSLFPATFRPLRLSLICLATASYIPSADSDKTMRKSLATN